MIKNMFLLFLLVSLALSAGCAAPATQAPVEATAEAPAETQAPAATQAAAPVEKVVIGMVTIASHPSLDAIQQGVKDALKEAGYEPGVNVELIERNAEGDMATLATIVQQFVDEGVDLIVATTTPAAQAAYKATQGQGGPPVFYNGVSNPYIAELATDAENHPAWVIGNQLLDPVAKTFELLKEINPDAKVVGIVYNPAEANSAYLLEVAKSEAEKAGLTLETATVSNSNEVQTAAESLLGRNLDAFLALSDNTVSSAFPTLVQTANDNDILLIGTSASFPPQGAVASYGIDPYQEGLDSGALIVRYLKGEVDIAKEPVQVQDAVLLTVNPAAAAEQGVTLPEALVSRADKVIE